MPVHPPRPTGPALNALRAFEAAARLGGFSKAAEELCVTSGAVAQQVKGLEDWAGADLFERQPQGVVLNDLGRQVLPLAERAFDQLAATVQEIRAVASPNRLHIAALPAVAQLWLSPRLPAIRRALPDLVISVTAMEQAPNLGRDPFDLTLFLGDPEDGQVVATDEILPVCAPDVAGRVMQVADLAQLPCLSDSSWSQDWAVWLQARAGAETPQLRGPVFSLYALAVQEAVNGAGVLMGHQCLIEQDLKAGRLVSPFPQAVPTGKALVLTARKPVRPPLARLIAALSESRL
ncbi:Gcv operon activator [Thalassovita gelatinovora]|uniref:Gcv operon activator n=1 Tax=Thalassovita gelatinovora TaxID=53501 RepID=A0A0P1FZV3_THAGE|nr:LysR substrate-binding domain-containing protein [Thalassovita gelatinovora]QIZ80489.1 LysR family transcriptional regulator [Thalassovita gelatinovora]CUH65934.1 Gcv operon activator [Thalassovita gelatinovora]SEQ74000.1 transcriptional regulator, LysR family [Thalassovita gelatinovora]